MTKFLFLSDEKVKPDLSVIFCNSTYPHQPMNSFQILRETGSCHRCRNGTNHHHHHQRKKKKTFFKSGTLFYKGIHIKRHSVHNIYTHARAHQSFWVVNTSSTRSILGGTAWPRLNFRLKQIRRKLLLRDDVCVEAAGRTLVCERRFEGWISRYGRNCKDGLWSFDAGNHLYLRITTLLISRDFFLW